MKGRPETIGFTLSAAVPIEAVGYVLKAMFDAGCPPNSLDLKAIVGGGAVNGHGHVIDAPAAPAMLQKKHASKFKAEHIREAILAIMSERFPNAVRRKNLFDAICERLGEKIAQARMNTVSVEFLKSGQMKSDGNGLYTLTKSGRREAAHVPAEPELAATSSRMSGNDFAYSIIKAEPQREFHLTEIKAAFEAVGRAPGSAKDAVSRLAQKGIIKRTSPSMFVLATGA
jgi:hypothetical protein